MNTEKFGVPKHSDLEPDYFLAQRNGNLAHDSGLGNRNVLKAS